MGTIHLLLPFDAATERSWQLVITAFNKEPLMSASETNTSINVAVELQV